MIRVLVTGAGGQLGKSLKKIYLDYPQLECFFFDLPELDITDPSSIREAFEEVKPEFCINCAAYTQVDKAELEPARALKVNAEGTENLARICTEYGTVLIHISTDYVFDGEKPGGYLPEDAPNPINAYGRSKWEGEKRIQKLLTSYFIIRTAWLYSEFPPNFYTTIKERLQRGEDLEVTDSQIGCPTHAEDLGHYLLSLICREDQRYGIRHFTGGVAMSWYEFACRIKERDVPGSSSRISKGNNYRSFARRPGNSILLP